MVDTERLLLEAVKSGLSSLEKLGLGACGGIEPDGIYYLFNGEEYIITARKAGDNSESRVINHCNAKHEESNYDTVTNTLVRLGVPAHIKGYNYIREAVIMAVEDASVIGSITKTLYPDIAVKFNTTPPRVERAIRHAIELTWNRGFFGAIDDTFGYNTKSSRRTPTNSEFIAVIADRIRTINIRNMEEHA